MLEITDKTHNNSPRVKTPPISYSLSIILSVALKEN